MQMELISPFVDAKVISYAAALDDKSYYGDTFIKPILREIGTKYFTPSLMYITKKGFPAPYKLWLEDPLSELWKSTMYAFELPEHLGNDHEYQWTMVCLYHLMKSFDISFKELGG